MMCKLFFLILYSGCFSTSGDMLNSLNSLFFLMNSSNVSTISFSDKLRVKFSGTSANSLGGIESFGPPVGLCILAHWKRVSDIRTKKHVRMAFCNNVALDEIFVSVLILMLISLFWLCLSF